VSRWASPAVRQSSAAGKANLDDLIGLMIRERVGSTYWGAQPELPQPGYALVSVRDSEARSRLLEKLPRQRRFYCVDQPDCDPWHLISGASEVIADADDELALISAMAGLPVRCIGNGRFTDAGTEESRNALIARHVLGLDYANPFTGEPMTPFEAVKLSASWRRLIDGNRQFDAIYGIASWKRETLDALMWPGGDVPAFRSTLRREAVRAAAIWRSRTPPKVVADLEHGGADIIEIEDGFIRSAGLGADCIPPSSVVVDHLGIYFDPSRPNDLERILEEGSYPKSLRHRARSLRELIVERGVTKYASGERPRVERRSAKRLILVPGQVEDDRAVLEGGQGLTSNLELLRRVRERAPDAHIIYKPHPDVEAGHRRGSLHDHATFAHADEVVRDQSISSLIDLVDEVHVNTSLAGFEALMRLKPVTTYGVPFYAGWGLTTDLGAVPKRRTARRTLDELVAAALILYPRYLDPKSGLPCPPEILVRRLAEGEPAGGSSALIWLRRLQGRLRRKLANVANG